MMNIKKAQAGFTLLELLLVIGLTASLIIGFGRLSSIWANRQLADLSGVHMQQVTEVVENYIRANLPTVGSDITADIAPLLPIGTTLTNPLRRDVSIELNVLGNNSYQAVIYTDGDPIPFDRLFPAARASGEAGGSVSNIVTPGDIAESAFGLWTADLAGDFGIAPTIDATGGQLVSYLSLSLADIYGGYLYRDSIAGQPELNQMNTDLNMNGFDIRSAGQVDANDVDVFQSATIGQLSVTGESTFAGNVDIGGTLDVGNQMVVDGDLTVTTGDVIVDGGNINAETMSVNTANATTINAPDISASNINITGANTILASDLSIAGGVSINVSGEVQANSLNANQISATDIISDQMTVSDNVTVDGDVTVTGSAVVDILAVDDCVQITSVGEDYGNC